MDYAIIHGLWNMAIIRFCQSPQISMWNETPLAYKGNPYISFMDFYRVTNRPLKLGDFKVLSSHIILRLLLR